MLLLIDNFDSFTYNLAQCFYRLGMPVRIERNDQKTVEELLQLFPSRLVIGPGPGNPSQAGVSMPLISALAGKIPILGVCLGHQCIGELYGGKIVRAKRPMHGKTSAILHDDQGIFAKIPQKFIATRYHSLIIEKESFPACLEISAETEEGEIMGTRHKKWAIEGTQFHPESILTDQGMKILRNFVDLKFAKDQTII